MKQFWLMKSEPDEVSIDDALASFGSCIPWTGVRNYQARNFIRDSMRVGDGVLFYHSSCPEPGIVGIAKVTGKSVPDETQFDAKSKYFDPKATRENPRWVQINVTIEKKIPLIDLAQLRQHPELEEMVVLRRGNRLSISPVTTKEWAFITRNLI